MKSYNNIFSCKEKVAVIIGGSGLIGREVAIGLHDFDAKVIIADVNEEDAISFIPHRAIEFKYLNIASEESIRETMAKIKKDSKRIDILVNCAYPRTEDWGLKLEEVKFDSWKKNVNDHLGGYFLCTRFVAEIMKEQGSGTIINLASIYGISAPDFSIYEGTEMTMPVAYSSIKAGIIAMTKFISTYYGKYNVRANSISPGGVFNNQPKSFIKRYSSKTPLNRMATPDEVVGAVLFLSSNASSYVTGHNLVVDGGWTAW